MTKPKLPEPCEHGYTGSCPTCQTGPATLGKCALGCGTDTAATPSNLLHGAPKSWLEPYQIRHNLTGVYVCGKCRRGGHPPRTRANTEFGRADAASERALWSDNARWPQLELQPGWRHRVSKATARKLETWLEHGTEAVELGPIHGPPKPVQNWGNWRPGYGVAT